MRQAVSDKHLTADELATLSIIRRDGYVVLDGAVWRSPLTREAVSGVWTIEELTSLGVVVQSDNRATLWPMYWTNDA